jgi:hypothetical protein
MSSSGSITVLINQLKVGDPHAAQQLWERYYAHLVCLARRMLQDTPRRQCGRCRLGQDGWTVQETAADLGLTRHRFGYAAIVQKQNSAGCLICTHALDRCWTTSQDPCGGK